MASLPRNQNYTEAAVGATLGLGAQVKIWTLVIPSTAITGNYDFTLPSPPNGPAAVEIVDVVVKKGGAGGAGDSFQLVNTLGAGITDAMAAIGAANQVVRPGLLARANTRILAGGTLRVAVVNGGIGVITAEIDVYYTEDT